MLISVLTNHQGNMINFFKDVWKQIINHDKDFLEKPKIYLIFVLKEEEEGREVFTVSIYR